MSTANTVYTPRQPIHKLLGNANIIISKNLQNIVTYLHNKVGNDEWSGPLFYEILEGDIKDPNSLKIMAHHVHLQDIGTGTYTEYNQNASDFMTVLEDYPDLMDGLMEGRIKIGHLHTHHSMKAFFSGTDDGELYDNCKNYNMYLSLIVSFDCKPVAKIAIKGKRKILNSATEDKFQFTGQSGTDDVLEFTKKEENKEYECIVEVDCNVNYEVDEQVSKQYETIKNNKKAKYQNNYSNYGPAYTSEGVYIGYGGRERNFQNPHVNHINQVNQKEEKNEWGIIPSDSLTSTTLARLISDNFQETKTAWMALTERNRIRAGLGDAERLAETSRIYNDFKKYVAYCIENVATGEDAKLELNNKILREFARSMKFWCKTYITIPYCSNLIPIFDNLVEKYDKLVKNELKEGKVLEINFNNSENIH